MIALNALSIALLFVADGTASAATKAGAARSDVELTQAVSFGGGGCGKVEGAVQVPCEGPNFEIFADTSCLAGRNYLHPLVQQTVVAAFAALATKAPLRQWQFGETGYQKGGPLWPHRSHQNGLSADFFVPVSSGGRPARVPISVLNKFGYGLEFDSHGKLDDLFIDWKALGEHLLSLEAEGKSRGVAFERIILTPKYRELLMREVPAVKHLEPLFMKKEAWVRHDEHYHIDFTIPAHLRWPLRCSGEKKGK